MHRGLNLAAHKDRRTATGIENAHVPEFLSLFATMPHDSLLVSSGDSVLFGQALDANGQIHSPVSGEVCEIVDRDERIVLKIRNDGRDTPHPSMVPITDYQAMSPAELRDRIRLAGIVGLGGAAFPTAKKLSVAADRQTRVLIINGVECEPYINCDDALMRASAHEVILGARALLHACGATECVIAIENDKPEAIAEMNSAIESAQDSRIRLGIVRHFYPAGGERQLIQTVVKREVPSGGIPADVNVLCHNVGTAAAIARLIDSGMPLVDRIVTLTGRGIREPRNLRVRFGTPISNLIAQCGGYSSPIDRLVIGGSMMGVAQQNDDGSICADTNCIIAATREDFEPRAAEMPCIRCGDCSEVCPASLLPQQLLRSARVGDVVALSELGLKDCIECGCCDYVCPSQIGLTSEFNAAKRALGIRRHT